MSIGPSAIPKDINASLHRLALEYIAKSVPSEGDCSRQAVQLCEFVSYSFMVIESASLSYGYIDGSNLAKNFVQLWPAGFLWAQYLQRTIKNLCEPSVGSNKDICKRFAEGISGFAHASSRCIEDNVKGKPLCDPRAQEFFIGFWTSSHLGDDIANEATEAFTAFMCLEGSAWSMFLDILQDRFGSARSLAAFVLDRARVALSIMDLEAINSHYRVLGMLLRALMHPIRASLFEEGVIALLMTTLTTMLDANRWTFDERRSSLELLLRMMSAVCGWTHGEKSHVAQCIKLGVLETYFRVGQISGLMENMNGKAVRDMFRHNIPVVMHLKSVSDAAHSALSKFSQRMGNRRFDIGSLSDSFKNVWTDFEILVLEHTILRHVHGLSIQRDVIYCSNVCF